MSTPSITYANFRAIFNRKIGDVPIQVMTDSDGADTTYDTAIASSLREYYTSTGRSDLFKDWWCYIPSTQEERRVESFDPETGTLKFYTGFSARVASSTAIELHKYRVEDKLDIINDCLEYVKEDGFFNPSFDETLWGQESYGEEPDEFNKREYTVPSSFEEFPEHIYLLEAYIGEHTGSDAADTLTDSNAGWETDELVGFTIYNKTDGSSGTVTANTSTTVTATLSGGTDNAWDEDDEYIVQKPTARPVTLRNYDAPKNAFGGEMVFYANIPENYLIKLVGKGPLSTFSAESDTTELYDREAKIVAEKAASMWFDFLADTGHGQDYEDAREKAARHLSQYEYSRPKRRKAETFRLKMDRTWT